MTWLQRMKFAQRLILIALLPSSAFSMTATLLQPHPHLSGPLLYDQLPWQATYFYGLTCNDKLLRVTKFGFHRWPEHVQSLELAYTLSEENRVRRFFKPIVGVVQLAGDFAVRVGANESTIYEFDPYIAFRWSAFPWNNYVNTSLAIGEGVSYATSYPSLEKWKMTHTKRFLNFLMFEASISLPNYPQWQLLARIHHRSGAFGLYHAENSGSNALGLGLRLLFD